MDALWRPGKVPLTGWLGALFVPALLCYLHSVNLNEYPILENSRVERLDGAKLDAIIPRDAKVRLSYSLVQYRPASKKIQFGPGTHFLSCVPIPV